MPTRVYTGGQWLEVDLLPQGLSSTSSPTFNSLTLSGNLTVNGPILTANSTNVTFDDLILTIGGDTAPVADDNKDRGFEFRWHNGTTAKIGFFGFKDSTGKFTFIPDSTNTSDVISGTTGEIDAKVAWANLLNVPSATTSVAGIVQLSDSTSTTSSTVAATSTAVKTAWDLANAALARSGGTMTGSLTLRTGAAAAGSSPLKFVAGTNLTSPEAGAMEWDGTNLFVTQTTGPTRKTVAYTDSNVTGTALNVTGIVAVANGGTGQASQTAAFNALSPLTTLGDLIYRDAANNVRLAGNTTATKQFLTQTGTGAVSAAPAWGAIVAGDLPSTFNAHTVDGAITFTTTASITTALASASVFNTGATTLNIGGAATTVALGAATGTTTVNNNLTVTGNLTINGTTITVNSTTVTVTDPIITLGGSTPPASNDSKDRGVEFRWHNGTVAKVGFFGFKNSTGKFTFIPDATNTSEVFSGTTGELDAKVAWTNLLSVPSATTSVAGIVQLSDSTSTTSSTIAATSTAVKTAWDLANAALARSGGTMTGTLSTAGHAGIVSTAPTDATVVLPYGASMIGAQPFGMQFADVLRWRVPSLVETSTDGTTFTTTTADTWVYRPFAGDVSGVNTQTGIDGTTLKSVRWTFASGLQFSSFKWAALAIRYNAVAPQFTLLWETSPDGVTWTSRGTATSGSVANQWVFVRFNEAAVGVVQSRFTLTQTAGVVYLTSFQLLSDRPGDQGSGENKELPIASIGQTRDLRFEGMTATTVPVNIRGVASQSAALTQWLNSSNTLLLSVTAGGVLNSAVATGTAPLTIASTTVVTNLNANFVEGQNLAALDTRFINTSGDTLTGNLTLRTGAAAAGSSPLKFVAGTNLTTPEAGAMEWDGTNLFVTQTTGPTRKTIAFTDSAITGNAANVTGTVAIANGGTGQTGQTAAFNALSPVTTLGDLIYRDASNNVRLAGNTTTTKQFLTQTGTGAASAAPAWGTIAAGDLPGTFNAFTVGGAITFTTTASVTTALTTASVFNSGATTVNIAGAATTVTLGATTGTTTVNNNLSVSGTLTARAGTATAGTAPLKFTAGTNLTVAEAGAVEWDGTSLFVTQTTGPTRKTVAYTDSNITGTAANVTGTVTIANGGTGQTGQTAAFNALSPLTTLGDLIYRDATNNVRLAGNTTAVKQFLTQTGTGTVSAAPAWGALAAGDIPSTLNAFTVNGAITFTTTASVTTALTTASVFNSGATTLNIGGAATSVTLGASTGTTTINNVAVVSGGVRQNFCGRASANATQTLTSGTNPAAAVVPLANESFDYSNMHDTTTNTGRVTCSTAGVYHFSAYVPFSQFQGDGTTNVLAGSRLIQIVRYNSTNAVQEFIARNVQYVVAATSIECACSGSTLMNAGDYVQIEAAAYTASTSTALISNGFGIAATLNWHLVRVT